MEQGFNKMNWPKYLLDRFWEKVKPPETEDGCWIWLGCCSDHGYGTFNNTILGQMTRAHRFSYEFFYGVITPDSLLICHTCDNPSCVNPDHLVAATSKLNMEDCKNKGRNVKGSELWSAKLSEQDVENIINGALNKTFTSAKQVITQFGISRTELCYIFSKKAWVEITDRFSKEDLLKAQYALNVNAKLTPDDIKDIRQRILNGETQPEIAKRYNVHKQTISRINRGIRWTRV
jgi:hypothetical protein